MFKLEVGPVSSAGWVNPKPMAQLHQFSCFDYPLASQQESYEQFKAEEFLHQQKLFLSTTEPEDPEDLEELPYAYSKPVSSQSPATRAQVLYSLTVFYTVMHGQYTNSFNPRVIGNAIRLYARTALRMTSQETTQVMAGLDQAVQEGRAFLANPQNQTSYIAHLNVVRFFTAYNYYEKVWMFRDLVKLWMAAYLETGNLYLERVYNNLFQVAAEFEVWAWGYLFILKETLKDYNMLQQYQQIFQFLCRDFQVLLGIDITAQRFETEEQLEAFQMRLFGAVNRLPENFFPHGKFLFNLASLLSAPQCRRGDFTLF